MATGYKLWLDILGLHIGKFFEIGLYLITVFLCPRSFNGPGLVVRIGRMKQPCLVL